MRGAAAWPGALAAGMLLLAVGCGPLPPAPADDGGDGAGEPAATEASEPERVTVLGIWGGEELESFEAMIESWSMETGNEVDFVGTRNITADLTIRVEGDDPPSVAIPAEIGLFREFARDGTLTPLRACEGLAETVRAEYPASFVELGTVDDELFGFFMKADTKGTIWYNPKFFAEHDLQPLTAESTFDDLMDLSAAAADTGTPPWSIGFESAEATGWPGSDWIQQILLNEAGPEVYDGVVDGSVAYDAPAVRDAWSAFGDIALNESWVAQGGPMGIVATNFQDAAYPPFDDPPGAAMVYLGGFASGFIAEQFPDAVAGEDYDFFPFPGGGVTGGANIVYAFDDDPATCSLLSWLASADAQGIWVERGGFTSVNTQLGLEAYPDAVSRAQAVQLAEAPVFRFDLDDDVGGAFQQALFVGVTDFLANPDGLDEILANIEAAR